MGEWDLIRESDWRQIIGICAKTAVRWERAGTIRPAVRIAGQRWRRADERPRPDDAPCDAEGERRAETCA